jgi:nitronate monooxygenase
MADDDAGMQDGVHAGPRQPAWRYDAASAIERLCERLGGRAPVLQAPMAGVQDAALAIAVARAGGLGALPCALLSPAQIVGELERLRASGLAAFNLNFFCHRPPAADAAREAAWRARLAPYYAAYGIDAAGLAPGAGRAAFSHELADLLEPWRPPVLSFHFGLPEPALLARVKAWGAQVLASATTLAEGRWLEAHGADAVIAQGLEAGGHRGHFLTDDLDLRLQKGTFALLPQLARALHVPVIAAGGVADAAGVAAARALGAAGVQVGTAYLLADEATTSALHRAALASEAAQETALTNLYTGRPARGIVTRLMRELGPMDPAAPAFPGAGGALAPLRAAAEAQGRVDFTPLWAGQSAPLARPGPAAALTADLIQAWHDARPRSGLLVESP